jgi:hypothetical protein
MRSVVAELFRANGRKDRQTDRQTEVAKLRLKTQKSGEFFCHFEYLKRALYYIQGSRKMLPTAQSGLSSTFIKENCLAVAFYLDY